MSTLTDSDPSQLSKLQVREQILELKIMNKSLREKRSDLLDQVEQLSNDLDIQSLQETEGPENGNLSKRRELEIELSDLKENMKSDRQARQEVLQENTARIDQLQRITSEIQQTTRTRLEVGIPLLLSYLSLSFSLAL